MKSIITTILLLIANLTQAQKVRNLESVPKYSKPLSHQTLIYGNFIQRLGFKSGGFPQYVRMLNQNTQKLYALKVKPELSSSKENSFFYYIPPGKYTILNYVWTESAIYGGKMTTEPIFKGIDTTRKIDGKVVDVAIKNEELLQFSFEIEPETITYLGTWNFETGVVSFVDEKVKIDEKLSPTYTRINFSAAKTVIPY